MPRSLVWFYILVVYVVVQLVWWGIYIVALSNQVYQGSKAAKQFWMIIGEGAVFLVILLVAVWKLKKTFRKEIDLNFKQRNFLLSTTHELKTPLSIIKLNLQTLLKRDIEKDQQDAILKKALSENDRLNKMIDNMLLASRMQSNVLSVNPKKLNLSEEVKRISAMLAARYAERDISIMVESNISVVFDEVAMDSILSNLVENAVKYSSPDTLIDIQLSKTTHGFELKVADKGIGISDKNAARQLFYREQNEETRTQKGSGLGLYIVQQFCLQMGFDLEIINNEGAGTIVKIVG